MPMYEYECPACSATDTVFRSITEHADPVQCPKCGHEMNRDFHAEAAGPHLDKEFHDPIQMHSVALCNNVDIQAFKRRNPDVDISDDPNDELYGVPIARTRRQKLGILEKEGFVERN